ncbi:RNA-binding protein [Trypanosoma theileri]|uniref:RNA-binding protein n=1 Tax=Trypanosoma theileri TaxID=67003 RepID=A0A1X0NJR4_9TRYP|nr:RNA-binding protein [Trypanosoma theileri]ORC84916.1 RNA-binding protein [Trypanosoma theileri]
MSKGATHTGQSGCCSVYVANIPPSVDSGQLRKFFSHVGTVLHVKLLLDIATGVSRGVAFLMFESIDVANRAVQLMNGAVMDNSVLQVRLSEKSSVHSCLDSHVNSNIVYIRNVPQDIRPEMVQRYCENYFGPVENVSFHPQSHFFGGPSPCNMVFVHFSSITDACKCVEGMDGKAPFPFPYHPHPFTVAKMIEDVNVEKRKSIILRERRPILSTGQLQGAIQAPGTSPQLSYINPINAKPVFFDTPPQLVQPTLPVSPIVLYQSNESFITVLPTQLMSPETHFLPQPCVSNACDAKQIFLFSI